LGERDEIGKSIRTKKTRTARSGGEVFFQKGSRQSRGAKNFWKKGEKKKILETRETNNQSFFWWEEKGGDKKTRPKFRGILSHFRRGGPHG